MSTMYCPNCKKNVVPTVKKEFYHISHDDYDYMPCLEDAPQTGVSHMFHCPTCGKRLSRATTENYEYYNRWK